MSKKTLLNEATIRRFMKLADVGNLTDNFINERGMAYQVDEPEEEEMPGDEGPEELPDVPEDDVGGEEVTDDLPDMDDLVADDEEGAEEGADEGGLEGEEEEVSIGSDDVETLLSAAEVITSAFGGGGGNWIGRTFG